jgi:hypothetical protein
MRGVFDTVILVRGRINPYSLRGRLLFDHSASHSPHTDHLSRRGRDVAR